MKLSKTQLRALRDFAEPGGHGYGEHTGIRRRTAEKLAKLGLVSLDVRRFGGQSRMRWATATGLGRDIVSARLEILGLSL